MTFDQLLNKIVTEETAELDIKEMDWKITDLDMSGTLGLTYNDWHLQFKKYKDKIYATCFTQNSNKPTDVTIKFEGMKLCSIQDDFLKNTENIKW